MKHWVKLNSNVCYPFARILYLVIAASITKDSSVQKIYTCKKKKKRSKCIIATNDFSIGGVRDLIYQLSHNIFKKLEHKQFPFNICIWISNISISLPFSELNYIKCDIKCAINKNEFVLPNRPSQSLNRIQSLARPFVVVVTLQTKKKECYAQV